MKNDELDCFYELVLHGYVIFYIFVLYKGEIKTIY